ncbi:hypothetical protein J7L00_06785 [Candidatus Bathyarchaeota archaeon]|nr:hypothetical protein [Candidatus Bathyarchaeota archaeon]
MRQSIRALGWTATILAIILFIFLASIFYSILQITILSPGIRMDNLKYEFRDGNVRLSLPILVNNTGYYEIDEFRIATTLKDENGRLIVTNSTLMKNIGRGEFKYGTHTVSLSLADIISKMRAYLFNDTNIKFSILIGFKYASVLEFQVSMVNVSIPWRAPFYGLRLKSLILRGSNGTHLFFDLDMDVENHFVSDIGGLLRLTIYNEKAERVGEGVGLLYLPSGERLKEPIMVVASLTNPEAFTGKGYAEITFQLPVIDELIEFGRVKYGRE